MNTYNKFFISDFVNCKKETKYIKPLSYASKITEKEKIDCCPLCGSKAYVKIAEFSFNSIIANWIEIFKINPIPEVYIGETLERRYCEECGLYYYNFHLNDSDQLYEELSKHPNYYPKFRSTYGYATEFIEKIKPNSLLEIGSGCGQFLERINCIVPNTVGSEYNSKAVCYCRERGLNVLDDKIENLKSESFDIVCNFEVLEHVYNTKPFIEQCVRLLKKKGKLIIGTPDPEGINSIISKYPANLPPHHQFDFSEKSLKWIAKKFNLEICMYEKTDLDYRHYVRFVKEVTGIEPTTPDILGFYETQKRFSGASHIVVFQK